MVRCGSCGGWRRVDGDSRIGDRAGVGGPAAVGAGRIGGNGHLGGEGVGGGVVRRGDGGHGGGAGRAQVAAQLGAMASTRLPSGELLALGAVAAEWSSMPFDAEAKRTED